MTDLDAATTLAPLPEALRAAADAQAASWGDPSALGEAASRAAAVLEAARLRVAALVDADPEGLLFTSSGTESDNLALKGLCAAAASGRRHLVISALEPYAVDHPARTLERQGWSLSRIGVDPEGRVTPQALAAALKPGTALVSVVLAHPGIGTWQALEPLVRLAHEAGALFHTDACVAAPFGPLSFRELGVDALSLSGHHLGGVAGAGALVLRPGLGLRPLIEGGTQEGGLRPGMPALGAIAALGAAAEVVRRGMPDRVRRLEVLGLRLREGLTRLPGVRLTGDPRRRIPGHASCVLDGLDGEALVTALAAEGVWASTGSPCASQTLKADPVLLALGLPESLARGSLRLSAGPSTTGEDVDRALGVLVRAVARLRALAPPATQGAVA